MLQNMYKAATFSNLNTIILNPWKLAIKLTPGANPNVNVFYQQACTKQYLTFNQKEGVNQSESIEMYQQAGVK